jgi:hypothetical protein
MAEEAAERWLDRIEAEIDPSGLQAANAALRIFAPGSKLHPK